MKKLIQMIFARFLTLCMCVFALNIFVPTNAYAYIISGSEICTGSDTESQADLSISFNLLPAEMQSLTTHDYVPTYEYDSTHTLVSQHVVNQQGLIQDLGMAANAGSGAFTNWKLGDILEYTQNNIVNGQTLQTHNPVIRCQFLDARYDQEDSPKPQILLNAYGVDDASNAMKWLNAFSFTPDTGQCWFFGNREIDCNTSLADVATMYRDSLEAIGEQNLVDLMDKYIDEPMGATGTYDRDPIILENVTEADHRNVCIERRISCYVIPSDDGCMRAGYPMTVYAPEIGWNDGATFEPLSSNILMDNPGDIAYHLTDLNSENAFILAVVDPKDQVDFGNGHYLDTNALLPIAFTQIGNGFVNMIRDGYGNSGWAAYPTGIQLLDDVRFEQLLNDFEPHFSDNIGSYIEAVRGIAPGGAYWCPMGDSDYGNSTNKHDICNALGMDEYSICDPANIFNSFTANSANSLVLLDASSYAGSVSGGGTTPDTESEFTITTTNMDDNTVFSFAISAAGTYTIDWGDDEIQEIEITDIENVTLIEHTYEKGGVYIIGISGDATEYSDTSVIYFGNSSNIAVTAYNYIAELDGSLSAIFPGSTDNMFLGTFTGCTELTTIHGTLFNDGINGERAGAAGMFLNTFSYCTKLNNIPADLFHDFNTPASSMFEGTFVRCTNLESIPVELFATIDGTDENLYYATFKYTGITSIPEKLFQTANKASPFLFSTTFSGCTKLKEIPADLFSGITEGGANYMFHSTFQDCTSLKQIPNELFDGISDVAEGMFFGTFSGCTALETLPYELFEGISDKQPAAAMFASTFEGCTSMKGWLPDGVTLTPENQLGWIPVSMFDDMDDSDYSTGYAMPGIFWNATKLATSCPENWYNADIVFAVDWGGHVSCEQCPDSGSSVYGLNKSIGTCYKIEECSTTGGNGTKKCYYNTESKAYDGCEECEITNCKTGYEKKDDSQDCSPIIYNITYDANGGSDVENGTYTIETPTFPLPKTTRTDYTFGGWYDNAEFTGDPVEQIEQGSTGNKTFWAKWEDCPYTISYNANGGTGTIDEHTCYMNQDCTLATNNFTRTGYVFSGWDTSAGGGVPRYEEGQTYTDLSACNTTKTLYAVWEPKTYEIPLDGNGNDCTGTESITVTYDAALPVIPSLHGRKGYKLLGYFDENDVQYYYENGKPTQPKWTLDSSITLYAKWEECPAGHYCPGLCNEGKVYEIECDIDSYASSTGATECTPCPDINNTVGAYNVSYTSTIDNVRDSIKDCSVQYTFIETWTIDEFTNSGAQMLEPTDGYDESKNNGSAVAMWCSYDTESQKYSECYQGMALICAEGYYSGGTRIEKGDYDGDEAVGIHSFEEISADDFAKEYCKPVGNGFYSPGAQDMTMTTNDGDIVNEYVYVGGFGTERTRTTLERYACPDGGLTDTDIASEITECYQAFACSTTGGNGTKKCYYNTESKTYVCADDAECEITDCETGYEKKDGSQDCSPIIYNITYDANGGSDVENGTYTIETPTFPLPKTTRTGYIFAGWYDKENLDGDEVTKIDQGSTGDRTFLAQWEECPENYYCPGNNEQIACPTPRNDIGAYTVKFDDKIDLNGNGVTDLIDECTATYILAEGWAVNTALLEGMEQDSAYDPNNDINKRGIFMMTSTHGNHEDEHIYNGKTFGMPVVCAGGYYSDMRNPYTADNEEEAEELNTRNSRAEFINDFCMPVGENYWSPSAETFITTGEWSDDLPEPESSNPFDQYEVFLQRYACPKNSSTQGSTTADWCICNPGYTLDGTINGETKTRYDECKPITYTITYDKNGGSDGDMAATECTYGQDCDLSPNTFTRNGYVFSGWNTSANGSGTAYDDKATIENITGAITLYAQWTPITYTITYVLGGGTNSDNNPKTYTVEQLPKPLNVATLDGYTFKGWKDDKDDNDNIVSAIAPGTTGNITLTAQWEPIEYTITYDANGGTTVADTKYTIETPTFNLPETTTRDGYTFDGWYNNANLDGSEFTQITKGSTEDKTFWAKWTPIEYTITYDLNGGDTNHSSNPTSYTVESEDIVLQPATLTGYTFDRWIDDKGNEVSTITKGSTGDITLTAQWVAEGYNIIYKPNGGSGDMAATECTYGQDCDLSPNTFTRNGYVFSGWNTSANGSGTAYDNEATIENITGAITLYAQWKQCDKGNYCPGDNEEYDCPAFSTSDAGASVCKCEKDFSIDGTAEGDKTVTNGTCKLIPEFTITTTNMVANKTFRFTISAAGTYYIDWDDGSDLQTVTITTPTNTIISHTYTTGDVYTIGISGDATEYMPNTISPYYAAISFSNAYPTTTNTAYQYIAGVSGSLGAIFGGNSKYMFYQTFRGCKSLTSIPEKLFSGVSGSAGSMFFCTFCDCSGLTGTIPENLFSGVSGSAEYMFSSTFSGCSGLTGTIPETLFENVSGSAEYMFNSTFAYCTSLTSIPENLFKNINTPAYRMFRGTFNNCSNITSVPAGLFAKITQPAEEIFAQTFQNTGLTKIPYGLFANLADAKPEPNMFYQTFKGCTNMEGWLPNDVTLTPENQLGWIPVSMFDGMDDSDYSTGYAMKEIFLGADELATSCPENWYNADIAFAVDWDGHVSCEQCPSTHPKSVAGATSINGCYTSCEVSCDLDETICPDNATCTYITDAKKPGNENFGGTCDVEADKCEIQEINCNNGYTLNGNECVANTYTITYDKNGGSGDMAATECTYGQDCDLSPNTFTRNGYVFSGWNTATNGSGTAYDNEATIENITGAITLYAQWTQCTAGKYCPGDNNEHNCPAGFPKSDPGATSDAQCYALCDVACTQPACDIKNAQSCEYESRKIDGIKYNDGQNICQVPSTANLTCAITGFTCQDGYAKNGNQCDANTYTITYDENGGSGDMAATECTYGQDCDLSPNTFTRNGYVFSGWNTATNGSGTAYDDKAIIENITGAITLYAQWTQCTAGKYCPGDNNEHNCPAGFPKSDPGATSDAQCYALCDVACTQPACDIKNAQSCEYESRKIDGIKYNDGQNICQVPSTANLTCAITGFTCQDGYAKNGNLCVANTYTITYDKNGGLGDMAATECTYGQDCDLSPNTFTRNGYVFSGWNTATNGSGTAYDNEATIENITGAITLYAQWTQCTAGNYCPGDNEEYPCPAFSTSDAGASVCKCEKDFSIDGKADGDKTVTVGTCKLIPEFTVKTINMKANETFWFGITAAGKFYVDCGEGGVLSGSGVTRHGSIGKIVIKTPLQGIAMNLYTCTYTKTGKHMIYFAGDATEYSKFVEYGHVSHGTTPAISFHTNSNSNLYIYKIYGSLGHIFGTIGNGDTLSKQPSFNNLFREAQNFVGPIPEELFDGIHGKPVPHMFSGAFSDCRNLTGPIPERLFNVVSGTSEGLFSWTFGNCTSLNGSIPTDLFKTIRGEPQLDIYYSTFYNCPKLTGELPPELFSGLNGAPAPYMFGWTFANNTGLTGQYSDLLFAGIDGAPAQRMYEGTFAYCKNITSSISKDFFGKINGNATQNMFASTFFSSGISGKIPEGLFADITGEPQPDMFNGMFYNCHNLTGKIPGNLFQNIKGTPVNESFAYMFEECSGLTGFVPPELFAGIDNRNYQSGPMSDIFLNSGIIEQCPEDMYQFFTGFESDWDSRVSCLPCPYGLHSPAGSTSIDQCVAEAIECSADFATMGHQYWDYKNGGYSKCIIEECMDGYHVELNACIPDEQSCAVTNGTGIKTWDNNTKTYGPCVAQRCTPGYTTDASLSDLPISGCSRCANMYVNGEIAVSGYVDECEIASCMYQGEKYILENNECVPICEEETDETGHRYWNGKECVHDCNAGYSQW